MLNFLKKIKVKFPFLWNWIERINGIFVNLFYGKQIETAVNNAIGENKFSYDFRRLNKKDASILMAFIKQQPTGFDRFFKPHEFSEDEFQRVLTNGTYTLIGCFDADKLIGYCFIRFVANKSAYRGKIVDTAYQGKGIAKQMGILMTKIAINSGFRLFATISKENIASLQSSKSVNNIRIIKELPNDYLYIEYLGLK